MMLVVLDTNHFREYATGSPLGTRLGARIKEESADVFTCIVVAEESLHGWVTFIRRHRAGRDQLAGYDRLHRCIDALHRLTILPFDHEAAAIFHGLEGLRLRIGTMDLKIAAICLAFDATLLSRNLSDFMKVPGLRVGNWLD